MISNIFGKTKPINFIIIFAFLFVLYGIVHFYLFDNSYELPEIAVLALIFTSLFFSIFVADFIVIRNKLTDPNSFAILYYALLIVLFNETLSDAKAIICSLFLLLATRRLITIRSVKHIKLKIFDATLWVLISSLFYEWTILFMLLVYVTIYIYEPKNIRNWLVPFVGLFVVFMITYSILVLAKSTDFLSNHYQFNVNLNYFTKWINSIRLISYILVTTLAGIFAFLKLGKSGLGQIVTLRIIGVSFAIGLLVEVLSSSPENHPILLTFFPAAIFMTNYVEAIKRENIKEIVLIASVVVPFLVLITSMALK